MLDLSQPSKLWITAESVLKAARDRLENVIKMANKQTPGLANEVLKNAWNRIGGKERTVGGRAMTIIVELSL